MTRLYGRAGTARGRSYAARALEDDHPAGGASLGRFCGVDEPTDTDVFAAYVEQALVPALRPGDIVVADHLSPHKVPHIRQMIEAAGAALWHLPPYSPDLNPIELMWSKIKAFLRKVKARTIDALIDAIRDAFNAITSDDARAWFQHRGYGTTQCQNALSESSPRIW